MIPPTRGASGGALPAAGWFSIGAASFVIAPRAQAAELEKVSIEALPEPCNYDILLVCQYPHALSRERLVPALAGRTNSA